MTQEFTRKRIEDRMWAMDDVKKFLWYLILSNCRAMCVHYGR